MSSRASSPTTGGLARVHAARIRRGRTRRSLHWVDTTLIGLAGSPQRGIGILLVPGVRNMRRPDDGANADESALPSARTPWRRPTLRETRRESSSTDRRQRAEPGLTLYGALT